MRRPDHLLCALLCAASLAVAGTENGWPCYHGPNRDNISTEKGLLARWPEEGPKLLWTASGLGYGYSTVAVAEGRIVTAGVIGAATHVTALDLSGAAVWQKPNGRSWEASSSQPWAVPYAGARGTPAIDKGVVYHMAEMGTLRAFALDTGEERWCVELLEVFEGERPKYGLSESVLIQGNRLYCCPGGKKGYMVALDTRSGETLWASTGLDDPVGYCSPVMASIDSVESLVTMSARRVLAFSPEDGRLLWQHAFGNPRDNSATDVIVHEGLVYVSAGYGAGSMLLRPRRDAEGRFTVEEVWRTHLLDNHHGGVLRVGAHLYGSGHEARGWFCLEFMTGRVMWQVPGKGALTFADGRLYCVDERGRVSLVDCTPQKWDAVSSFSVPSGGKGMVWAHPVVCGGRLYVRHSDTLFAYDIKGK